MANPTPAANTHAAAPVVRIPDERLAHHSGDAFQARATHAPHRARILGLGLSVGIAIAAAFTCGVNSGYDLGADTMQCVAFAMLAKESPDVVNDACKAALTHSQHSPTFMVRKGWLWLTGDAVPEGAFSASGMSAGTAETQSGSGRKPASPTAEGGDAQ